MIVSLLQHNRFVSVIILCDVLFSDEFSALNKNSYSLIADYYFPNQK